MSKKKSSFHKSASQKPSSQTPAAPQPSFQTITFEIEPLDPLFFRDGRPFDAGTGAQIRSGLPSPQGVCGAMRTWLLREAGCDFEMLKQKSKEGLDFAAALAEQPQAAHVAEIVFRGPWFCRRGEPPLFPAPLILRRPKGEKDGELLRLSPLSPPPPGWEHPEGLAPLWSKSSKTLAPTVGYLTLDGLAAFLRGETPGLNHLVSAEALYRHDRRVSVSIAPETMTGRDGHLFSAEFLAFGSGVCLAMEAIVSGAVAKRLPKQGIIFLGGEGRRAAVRMRASIVWPGPQKTSSMEVKPNASGPLPMLVLTTPGVFEAPGWRPPQLRPIAAATGRAEPVSGWDLARGGPKPTRFAVPAGAVYFLDQAPEVLGSLCAKDDAMAGWGCFLEGVWSHDAR